MDSNSALDEHDVVVIDDRKSAPAPGGERLARPIGRSTAAAVSIGARRTVAALGIPASEMPLVNELREVAYDEMPADAEGVVTRMRQLLDADKGARQHVRLALPSSWFEVAVLELPPASPADTGELIERELRRRPWLRDEAVLWKAVPLGTFDHQVAYLVAATPQRRVEELLAAAARAKIQVELICPPQLTTLEVLRRFLGPGQPAEAATALLHFDDLNVTLAVIHEGRPVQLRTLPFDATNLASGAADGLIAELRRSTLFFKQRSHGRTLDSLFVTGLDRERREVLRDVVRERLSLEAQSLVCPGIEWPDASAIPLEHTVLVGLLQGKPMRAGARVDLKPSSRGGLSPALSLLCGLVLLLMLGGAWLGRVRLQRSVEKGLRERQGVSLRVDAAREEASAAAALREELGQLVGGLRAAEAVRRSDLEPAMMCARILEGLDSNVMVRELVVDQGAAEDPAKLESLLRDEAVVVAKCTLAATAYGELFEAQTAVRRAAAHLKRLGAAELTHGVDQPSDGAAGGPVDFQLEAKMEVKAP
ncbi:MAG: hypothetical protein AB1486_11965 [Planctomycetota bacterium]